MTARATRPPARLAVVALAVALGCRPAAPPRSVSVVRTPLATTGATIAVVEQADALYVFTADHATIERSGAAITVPAPRGGWAQAVAIAALDGDGRWVVGRTAAGELWRITLAGELEPIDDRLGLPPRARSIAASGATVAIALDDGVAILGDRAHVARFGVAAGDVIASRDRVAIRRGDDVDVWNLVALTHVVYRVPGAITAAFAGDPAGATLVVATRDALFVEAAGALRRLDAPGELRDLAAAGSRLWVATVRGVYLLDGDALVQTTVAPAAADHLFGLADGDVVLATPSGLARLTIERADDDPRWTATVGPIFERVCARCHRPGGNAGVDLSTAAAWRRERAELIHRVVDTRTMPPAGTRLDDADRAKLSRWLAH